MPGYEGISTECEGISTGVRGHHNVVIQSTKGKGLFMKVRGVIYEVQEIGYEGTRSRIRGYKG